MKPCEKCGTPIDEKYKYCQACNKAFAGDNAIININKNLEAINETLDKINWNLGLKNEFFKQTNPALWDKIEKSWLEKKKKRA